jgi:hypothetical protein
MKIVRKDKYSLCEFGELKVGDVFIEMCEGNEFVQMKMEPRDEDGEIYNAVCLTTGETYALTADTRVRRVHAELTIENIEEA